MIYYLSIQFLLMNCYLKESNNLICFKNSKVSSKEEMFEGCSSLSTIPEQFKQNNQE